MDTSGLADNARGNYGWGEDTESGDGKVNNFHVEKGK